MQVKGPIALPSVAELFADTPDADDAEPAAPEAPPAPSAFAPQSGSSVGGGKGPSKLLALQGAAPALSLEECKARLTTLAAKITKYRDFLEQTHNPLAVFSTTYIQSTVGLLDKLNTNPGFFENPSNIVLLAEAFAERYFDGMNAAMPMHGYVPNDPDFKKPLRAGVEPPLGWIDVAKHMQKHPTLVMEDLVLGITVHICYDLPIVLSHMNLGDAAFMRDFDAFNKVLEERTNIVQDLIGERYGQGTHLLDQVGLGFDEAITAKIIGGVRETAKQDAKRLALGDTAKMDELRGKVGDVLRIAQAGGVLGDMAIKAANITRRWPSH